jgi:hypothetical protein
VVAAYALPAALTWMLLGLGVAAVAQSQAAASRAVLGGAALVAALAYSGYYGVSEAVGRPGVRPPGRSWQVPQTMVIGASPRRRIVVWGAVLGPGFLTRNPYAGFGLLPLILIAAASFGWSAGLVVGAGVGIAHGTARALALLRDVRDVRAVQDVRAGRDARAGRRSHGAAPEDRAVADGGRLPAARSRRNGRRDARLSIQLAVRHVEDRCAEPSPSR